MPARELDTLKLTTIFSASRNTSTSLDLYNGQATGANTGLDTQKFDEAIFHINMGPLSAGTYDFSVYESDTDTSVGSTLVTDASFTQVTTSTDLSQLVGFVRCADTKRYLWLKSTSSVDAGNADIAAVAILGKGASGPEDNSEEFAA